ncbi:hypothetical protein [Methylocystis sp.]
MAFDVRAWRRASAVRQEKAAPTLTPQALATFARPARKRMRDAKGGYPR